MTKYIIKRLLASVLVLLGVVTLVFFVSRVLPSNPATKWAGTRATEEQLAAAAEELGLNDPLPVQYINYLDTRDIFQSIGITDDKWLVVIAMGMAAMNIILLRNAFEGVPSDIEEAAVVDGASEFQVLTKVYIPMSKSTIATVALFFAISRWNGYFWARQMISNSHEHPLQVFIRLKLEEFTDPDIMAGWNEAYSSDSVIYALIVCSIVPILVIYPFIQKYFAKGVNVGGVKE